MSEFVVDNDVRDAFARNDSNVKYLYTVWDKLARISSDLIMLRTDDEALRFFRINVLDKADAVAKDDYELYRVGGFNVVTKTVFSTSPKAVLIAPIVKDEPNA